MSEEPQPWTDEAPSIWTDEFDRERAIAMMDGSGQSPWGSPERQPHVRFLNLVTGTAGARRVSGGWVGIGKREERFGCLKALGHNTHDGRCWIVEVWNPDGPWVEKQFWLEERQSPGRVPGHILAAIEAGETEGHEDISPEVPADVPAWKQVLSA